MQFCFACGTSCANLLHTPTATLCTPCSDELRTPASTVFLGRGALYDNLMFA